MKRNNKHLWYFLIFLVFIIGIECGAQYFRAKEHYSIPVLSNNIQSKDTSGLSVSEKAIIDMLNNSIVNPDVYMKNAESEYTKYIRHLQDYLSSSGVDLSTTKAYDAVNNIIKMNEIMSLEHENNINKMSIDGRELAINLSQKVYKACGLHLIYDIQGNITQILNKSGDYIYLNNPLIQKAEFQWELLLIALTVVFLLLSICFIIAKKNQLYIKDVIYDGFNEEEFV